MAITGMGNGFTFPLRAKLVTSAGRKTLDHRPKCSECNLVQRQFCGDCLFMRILSRQSRINKIIHVPTLVIYSIPRAQEKIGHQTRLAVDVQVLSPERKTIAAIQCLKRKILYEQQVEQLGNFQLRIHDQMIMLEGAKATTEIVDALRTGGATMKAMQKATNIDDVDNTIDEINEQTDNMKQIQDALSAPFGSAADFDERRETDRKIQLSCGGDGGCVPFTVATANVELSSLKYLENIVSDTALKFLPELRVDKDGYPPFALQVTEKINIRAESIRKLKEATLKECDFSSETLPTFEVIEAYLWKSRVKALSLDGDGVTSLGIAVGIRNAVNPPLPDGYYGNAYIDVYVPLTAKEVEEHTISDIVKLIKQAKRKAYDKDYLQKELVNIENSIRKVDPSSGPVIGRCVSVRAVTGASKATVKSPRSSLCRRPLPPPPCLSSGRRSSMADLVLV
ncbi:hypothetical protein Bca52824_078452 [Brassica carinata]|uniref:Uncharacterized protein n=1 Tax=Brassica carinata TaxID=52824 RepID=A0A8X7PZ55_BRACI|nr:hypothetical protein Bca52824_078452 [Brassica carinata]